MKSISTQRIKYTFILVILFLNLNSYCQIVPMPWQEPEPVKLSLSVVSYELANSYKIKADELFLQDQYYYAKKNYLKAQNILSDPDRFRANIFDESKYVTGFDTNMDMNKSKEASRIYRELLTKDIDYRLSLLDAGEDFYGIEFSQNVLLPGVRFQRWKQSTEDLLNTWNSLNKLLDEKEQIDRTDSETRRQRIQNAYGGLINIKEQEKVSVIQTVASKRMNNFSGRNNEIMSQQQNLSNDLNKLSEELAAAEAAILDNFTNTLGAAFNMPQLSHVQGLLEGKDINIQTVLKAGSQYFEPFEQLGAKMEWIQEITTYVSTGEKIVKFLENPNDDEFMEILGEIAPGNEEIKTLREWYETGDQIVKTFENVNRCRRNFTYDCLSDNVNDILSQADVDSELLREWRILDAAFNRIDLDEVASNLSELIKTGNFDAGLRLGDKLANLDPDFKQNWDKGRSLSKQFTQALEKGTFEGFLDFGKELVDQGIIPIPEFEKIKNEVANSKPLGILLEFARHELGDDYFKVFDEINQLASRTNSNTLIDKANFQAAINYKSPSPEFQVLLYQELINAFPQAFINQMNADTRRQVAEELRISQLTHNYFKPGLPLNIKKERSSFLMGNAILPSIEDMISYARNGLALNKEANLKGFTNLAIMTAYEFQAQTKKYYKTAEVVELMKGNQEEYEKIMSLIPSSMKSDYDNYAAYIQLGRYGYFGDGKDFKGVPAAQEHRKTIINNLINESQSTTDPKLKEALARQALTMGLNAAVPGLGSTVNAAISFFASMTNASNLIDQMNEKSRQIKENQKEMLDLDDKILDANEKLSIAQLESERLDLVAEMMELENQEVNVFLDYLKYDRQDIREELQYILPVFFYQNEIVRQNYYLLNKSVKFWHGYSMKELITNNKNNVRLALDPDIRLFEWLRLDKTGQRTNLKQIIGQWQRIDDLFPDNSDNSDLVIKGPDRRIAFEKGASFSVFDYSEVSKEEYYNWRENPRSSAFEINFQLSPNSRYFGKNYVNGRLARVSISKPNGGSIPNGAEMDLELPYPVLRETGIENEYLTIEPVSLSGSNRGIETDWRDMRDYKDNFAKIRDPETLEGVGIHANFVLRLPYRNADQFDDIDDIIIDMSWTFDRSIDHKPVSESEPQYDSVDIFLSNSRYDYTRLAREELVSEAKTIAELQTHLEKRKADKDIYDYRINRPVFTLNYN